MERDIPGSYLRCLDKLYRAWRARWDLSPVIELRTDRLDYITDLVDRLDLSGRSSSTCSSPCRPASRSCLGPRAWARARPLAAITGLVRPQAPTAQGLVAGVLDKAQPEQLGRGGASVRSMPLAPLQARPNSPPIYLPPYAREINTLFYQCK
jgi:hypothetical protein